MAGCRGRQPLGCRLRGRAGGMVHRPREQPLLRPDVSARRRVWRYLRGLGIAASRVAVGGDSAGGGLTLALIGRLIELGEELPACAWLVSPWTDLTMSGATLATKDGIDPI